MSFKVTTIKGFSKVVKMRDVDGGTDVGLPDEICCIWVDYNLGDATVNVPLEESGDYIIPYYNTGLFINLDTMNIIYEGKKNGSNKVFCSLDRYIQKMGIVISRDEIVYSLERFLMGHDMQDCFALGSQNGSLIAGSLSYYMNINVVRVLYNNIMDNVRKYGLKDRTTHKLLYIDQRFTSKNDGVIFLLKLLRAVDKDYFLRSCLDMSNFTEMMLTSLQVADISVGMKGNTIRAMDAGKFNLEDETKDNESEVFERFVDLDRLINKVKEVTK